MRQYSLNSLSLPDSTTFTLVFVKHRYAKWFILSPTKHFFPKAEQLFLVARCFPPQNLHLSTSLWLESFTSRSSFSHLLLAELSHLLLGDTLPRFVCFFNEFTATPSSKVFVRVSENLAALQMLRYLCKSKSGILGGSSRSCWSWILQMIRSLNFGLQGIFRITEVTGRR